MTRKNIYKQAFEQAASAQWLLHSEPLRLFLSEHDISDRTSLELAFAKPSFANKLRIVFSFLDVNQQAVCLFGYQQAAELVEHLAWHWPDHVLQQICVFSFSQEGDQIKDLVFTDHHQSPERDIWLRFRCDSESPYIHFSGIESTTVLQAIEDVEKSRAYEQERALSARILESSADGIYITNKSSEIVQINQSFTDITGFKKHDVMGKKPSYFASGWHKGYFSQEISPLLKQDGIWCGEIMGRRKSGEAFVASMRIAEVRDSHGLLINYITSFREEVKSNSSDEKVKKLAYYDPLTELPNRTLFADRLQQALQRGNRSRHYVALLFLDLDGFKPVNDRYGHAFGDKLLTDVAGRLVNCVRADDTVARMGGDEFAIVLHSLKSRDIAESRSASICKKILKVISEPFLIEGEHVSIGTSIGIALYPDDSINQDTLLRYADVAMYHAKKLGKNQYQFYTDDMHSRDNKRQALAQDLERAIHERELFLCYQPRYRANDLSLVGFEALLRWRHVDGRILNPSMFLRGLNEHGLGEKVGELVIDMACEQLSILTKHGFSGHISVNMFRQHFRAGKIASFIKQSIDAHGIDASQLTLEFKETMLMEDPGFAYSSLNALKSVGVNIALDDFATGELALQSLRRLPVDEMKVDKQFIFKLDQDESQLRFVETLINLAKGLNAQVCIEGVERESQLDLLRPCAVDVLQGYLFSEPLQPDQLGQYLQQQKRLSAVFKPR